MTVEVSVNGRPQKLPDGATVATVVAQLTDEVAGRGVAVAVGGEVVPRGQWPSTVLRAGTSVEVVRAVQGG